MKKWMFYLMLSVLSLPALAQEAVSEKIEMADVMRSSGKIYVVVLVVAVILTGLIIYLIQLDKKIRKLEVEFSQKSAQ